MNKTKRNESMATEQRPPYTHTCARAHQTKRQNIGKPQPTNEKSTKNQVEMKESRKQRRNKDTKKKKKRKSYETQQLLHNKRKVYTNNRKLVWALLLGKCEHEWWAWVLVGGCDMVIICLVCVSKSTIYLTQSKIRWTQRSGRRRTNVFCII